MISAFGVDHGEVSKALRPVAGMKAGFKGAKLYRQNAIKEFEAAGHHRNVLGRTKQYLKSSPYEVDDIKRAGEISGARRRAIAATKQQMRS